MQSYLKVFHQAPSIQLTYSIKIRPSISLTIRPPHKVPISLKDEVYEELQKWRSYLTGKQHDGSKQRIHNSPIRIDPWGLNNAVQNEHFPLKNAEDVIEGMS